MKDLIKAFVLQLDSNSEAIKSLVKILIAGLCITIAVWLLIYVPIMFTLMCLCSLIGVWMYWDRIVSWAKNNDSVKQD